MANFRASHFFDNRQIILGLYVVLVFVVALKQLHGLHNNYFIFKYTFYHAADQLNLYAPYPAEHGDTNHYGPFFSLLFAPFALLPDFWGALCWQLVNVLFLFYAIGRLPLSTTKVNIIYWIIAHEMLTAMFSYQPNISIAAIVVLAYCYIKEERYSLSAFLIMLGTFVKLYGIVGLAFFFFVRDKRQFILWLVFWASVFFILPMLFFGVSYILGSYADWYTSLSEKEGLNAASLMQDISVMGMARRISGHREWGNLPFMLGGMVLYFMPFLRIKQYKSLDFQLLLLAATLLFAVIFSNSSESPTYIIAFVGVAIWFVLLKNRTAPVSLFLFVFALVLTSLSPSDLFPKFVRQTYIIPYALKALPCLLVWLHIVYLQLTSNFIDNKKMA